MEFLSNVGLSATGNQICIIVLATEKIRDTHYSWTSGVTLSQLLFSALLVHSIDLETIYDIEIGQAVIYKNAPLRGFILLISLYQCPTVACTHSSFQSMYIHYRPFIACFVFFFSSFHLSSYLSQPENLWASVCLSVSSLELQRPVVWMNQLSVLPQLLSGY